MFTSSNSSDADALVALQQRTAELEALLEDKDIELRKQQQLLAEREAEISVLTEKLSPLLAKRYRHSSEKLDALQISLFDEAELQSEIDRLIEELAGFCQKVRCEAYYNNEPTNFHLSWAPLSGRNHCTGRVPLPQVHVELA